jgi:hypothetical protein
MSRQLFIIQYHEKWSADVKVKIREDLVHHCCVLNVVESNQHHLLVCWSTLLPSPLEAQERGIHRQHLSLHY